MELCLGVITDACNMAKIGRSTFYRYMKTDKEFADAINEIDELAIDFVESKLFERIRGKMYIEKTIESNSKGDTSEKEVEKEVQPDTTAIIFFLKTKGKKRGYSERDGDDHDINVNIIRKVKPAPTEDNG